jgi:hypothetical protein
MSIGKLQWPQQSFFVSATPTSHWKLIAANRWAFSLVPSLEVSEDLKSFYGTLWARLLSPVPLLDSEPKKPSTEVFQALQFLRCLLAATTGGFRCLTELCLLLCTKPSFSVASLSCTPNISSEAWHCSFDFISLRLLVRTSSTWLLDFMQVF